MEIERVTDFEQFCSLQAEWDALVDRCEWSCVSLTHPWLSAWWKAFRDDATLWVLLVRQHGRLTGVMPLMLRRERFHGFPARALSLMLNGHTPTGGFLFEQPEQCYACCLEYLIENRAEWDMLCLEKLPQKIFNGAYFGYPLEQKGFSFIRADTVPVPFTEIKGSWEHFLSTRSKKFKKVLRNKLNRMERDGLISVETIPGLQVGSTLFGEMLDVSRRSWKGKQGRSIPDDPRVQHFYRELSEALGRAGMADLWILRHDGKAIALEYHVRHKGITYPIRADFDEAYHALSPGSLLEYMIMKHLFSDSTIHGYNSCGQTYEYLMNWATDVVEHLNIHLFNSRAYSKNLFRLESRVLPLMREAKSFFGHNRMRRTKWEDQESFSKE